MVAFWTKGYEATGVAELCSEMGLGRQSLYNAFGDKEALFAEALERYQDVQLKPMIEILEGPGSGLDNVHRVLDLWEERARSGASMGCFMANSIAEFGMRAPALSPTLGSMLGTIEDAFLLALERAQSAGELPPGRDPRTLARLLTTLGQGLSTVGKLDPTGTFTQDALASARALLS